MFHPVSSKNAIMIFALIFGGLIFLFSGFLNLFFTAEDFTFIYLYHRMPFLEIFTEPNLKATVITLYRPVTDLIIYLETALFGGTPWPWHIVNLILHGAVVYQLFRVSRWIIGSRGALCAAILFAWHPILPGMFSFNVGGVQVGFLLLFTLMSFDHFARFRIDGKKSGMWFSALFMFLAIGSYEWLPLPGALLFFDLALARKDGLKGRLVGILHHLPVWAGVILLLLARKAVLGVYIGGYPLDLSPKNLVLMPIAFLKNIEEYCINPVMNGMFDRDIRNFGRSLILAGVGLPFIYWLIRLRFRYLILCILLGIMFLCACIPIIIAVTHDPAGARRFYLPMAFVSLLMGMALTGGYSGSLKKKWSGYIPFVIAGIIAIFYGCMTYHISPYYIKAGTLTKKIQEEVLEIVGPDYPKNEAVFLLNTPMNVNADIPGTNRKIAVAKTYQFGLSMAFSPPFCERDLKVFPLPPKFNMFEGLPMLFRLGSAGKLLTYDVKTEKVKPYIIENIWEQGRDYRKKFGKGNVGAPIQLRRPENKNGVWYMKDGFTVSFAHRKAPKYRVVVLTQHYPWWLDYRMLRKRDKPTGHISEITEEMVIEDVQQWKEVVKKKKWVEVKFDFSGIRDSLSYFHNEPVFLWMETLDEAGKTMKRSSIVKFRLLDEDIERARYAREKESK